MLRVIGLQKAYPDHARQVLAVKDVSFEVAQGAFYTLLGPSGCGKTTILRSIAGLEYPERGEIQVGGIAMFSASGNIFVPPHKRDMGIVFQNYAV